MRNAKGKVAEREVAALCLDWWRMLEPDCSFVRTPLSGGWGGPQLRGEFKAAGDLMTTARQWPFTVEVKRRERWELAPLQQGQPSPVWSWWRQVQAAAEEEARWPMLWFRRSREPWRVMLQPPFAAALRTMGRQPAIAWKHLRDVNVIGPMPEVFFSADVLAIDPGELLYAAGGIRR